ncbi:uncharacterized protein OCT59_005840 [Rhizophagus irregularis]|uniref:uncharacterized protein n=1 Tax=Rhizophagus irregularis TaxID=588596 RepID=UPI00332AE882|nr:hypothetical protein OCT59_005840 [Rhizophagus irregularis]
MSNNFEIKVTENSDERLKRQYEMDFHENIIRFCGITIIENQDDDSKNYWLVMEYADNGTLRNYSKEHFDSLNWDNKLNIALQLARAVSSLHEKEIVHHNLHSNNELVHQGIIKLTDFGLSKKIEESTNLQSNFFDMVAYIIDPKLFEQKRINNHQIPLYLLNKKSNIYSIGVFLWEISSGQSSFYNESSDTCLDLKILQGLREKPVANTPIDYVKIYIDCWNHEPDNRSIISDVIAKLNVIILNKLSKIEPSISLYENDFQIVVDDLVALIDNLEQETGKEEVLDYLNDHDITPRQIYNWLLYNQTNLNSVLLLGDFLNLGIESNCYEVGAGTYVDKQKAFELYQKAGDFGILSGINNLAYCYRYEVGNGTSINKYLN